MGGGGCGVKRLSLPGSYNSRSSQLIPVYGALTPLGFIIWYANHWLEFFVYLYGAMTPPGFLLNDDAGGANRPLKILWPRLEWCVWSSDPARFYTK